MINIVFVAFGFSISVLFMVKIEWLMDKKKYPQIVLYCAIMYVASYLFLNTSLVIPAVAKTLRIPIFSFGIFVIFHSIFRKIFKRDPENTYWAFTSKPIQDVIFCILFWVLGILIPILYLIGIR